METILAIKLTNGLCNKLFMFINACDIAINKNIKLLEPKFGWKTPILFSEIYDLEKFNSSMKEYNNGQDILIPFEERSNYTIIRNNINLWNYSKKKFQKYRQECKMLKNCMNIIVLQCLQLNENNQKIAEQNINKEINSVHLRLESDWQKYSKSLQKRIDSNERILIDLDTFIELYNELFNEHIFFTSGQNHEAITNKFSSRNIKSNSYFNSNFEYEINAAINFEICCHSEKFIGLSRSTFSNLITLKRFLNGNDNSYIYNLNNTILQRIDAGLQCNPICAISKKTSILDY